MTEHCEKLLTFWDNITFHPATLANQIGNSFSFQYDNDPKQNANAVKAYLDRKT